MKRMRSLIISLWATISRWLGAIKQRLTIKRRPADAPSSVVVKCPHCLKLVLQNIPKDCWGFPLVQLASQCPEPNCRGGMIILIYRGWLLECGPFKLDNRIIREEGIGDILQHIHQRVMLKLFKEGMPQTETDKSQAWMKKIPEPEQDKDDDDQEDQLPEKAPLISEDEAKQWITELRLWGPPTENDKQ